jgi:ribosomal protein S7
MGQGQFLVQSSLFDDLNKIDNKIVEYVQKGNEKAYKKSLAELIELVLREGKKVSAKELVESDIIVPPGDMTLEEARQVFTGTGIFKG